LTAFLFYIVNYSTYS